jgi:hypothetical protein
MISLPNNYFLKTELELTKYHKVEEAVRGGIGQGQEKHLSKDIMRKS